MKTIMTKYEVTRLAWNLPYDPRATADPHDNDRATVKVWGNGADWEREARNAGVEFEETASVVVDLGRVMRVLRCDRGEAIEVCEDYALNTIDRASGVVDITEDVIAGELEYASEAARSLAHNEEMEAQREEQMRLMQKEISQ